MGESSYLEIAKLAPASDVGGLEFGNIGLHAEVDLDMKDVSKGKAALLTRKESYTRPSFHPICLLSHKISNLTVLFALHY